MMQALHYFGCVASPLKRVFVCLYGFRLLIWPHSAPSAPVVNPLVAKPRANQAAQQTAVGSFVRKDYGPLWRCVGQCRCKDIR